MPAFNERWTPPDPVDRSLKGIKRRLLSAEAAAPGGWVLNPVREQISFQRDPRSPVEYLDLLPGDPATDLLLAAKQDIAVLLNEIERLEGFFRSLGLDPQRKTFPYDIQQLRKT